MSAPSESIHKYHLGNGSGTPRSSTKSVRSEHRPSFSITLPASFSKSQQFQARVMTDFSDAFTNADGEVESTAGFEEALNGTDNRHLHGTEPHVRRKSVQFIPGEDDNLLRHEAKNGLPKTPYPTTEEQDARIQSTMFSQ
ncbi:hypothetical protein EMPS_01215 [Entomortierella parvispora]|uniref:Uncharacterized protein n=1 Tax=Entomortierella parvispora TaxID=205924 RepID=A0A9P3H2L1_9FUNG|nr:hypothetical protein EMPS_01215 [Entomortierella parvispora]